MSGTQTVARLCGGDLRGVEEAEAEGVEEGRWDGPVHRGWLKSNAPRRFGDDAGCAGVGEMNVLPYTRPRRPHQSPSGYVGPMAATEEGLRTQHTAGMDPAATSQGT